MTKPYALYARTSTDKQDISKQVFTLEKWAADRGVKSTVFADDNTSGGSFDNRPEYTRMMRRIGGFEAVVVYNLDRNWGVPCVASTAAKAKELAWAGYEYELDCDWIDLRVHWQRAAIVEDLPFGIVDDEYAAISRKLIDYIYR